MKFICCKRLFSFDSDFILSSIILLNLLFDNNFIYYKLYTLELDNDLSFSTFNSLLVLFISCQILTFIWIKYMINELKYINKIKIIKLHSVKNILEIKQNICNICMTNNCNSITNCGHIFCKRCLDNWFKNAQECPMCRTYQNSYIVV